MKPADPNGPPPSLNTPDHEETTSGGFFRRTWELELLISGAILFALFQLPSRLVSTFQRLEVVADEGVATILFISYVYLQLVVFILIGTLIVHLASRAYWVGLIGLRSVFPQGVRWRQLTSLGPRTKAFYRAAQPSLGRLIQTTDAFCSSLFSIAFFLSLVFLASIFIFAPIAGLAVAVDRAFFGGERFLPIFYVLVAVLLLPATLLPLLDKKIARKARNDRFERFLRIALRPYYWLFGAPLVNPIQMTLRSHSRTGVFVVVYALVLVALFATTIGGVLVSRDALGFHGLLYFPPHPDAHALAPVHYRDQRPPGTVSSLPSIPSDVVTGPYLRLFLPYLPRRHNAQIASRCPELEPLQAGGLHLRRGSRHRPRDAATQAATAAALSCLAGLYEVELDGEPLGEVDRSFYREPESGVRGLLVHLPAAGLAAGKHVLRIRTRTELAKEEDADRGEGKRDGEAGDEAVREYVIPFWR